MSYQCDGCRKTMKRGALRYAVEINIHAAYDDMEIGLLDLVRDHRAEMLALIERLKDRSPKEIEETVYKVLKLDLCPSCQRAFIADPLRFHPEQGAKGEPVQIEEFLKSLGYGSVKDEDLPGESEADAGGL